MLASCYTTLIAASLAITSNAAPQSLPSMKRDDAALPSCSQDSVGGQNRLAYPAWAGKDIGGKPFCTSQWDKGRMVTKIWTFKHKDAKGNCYKPGLAPKDQGSAPPMNRLEVTYSDGTVVAIGSDNKDCPAGEIDIAGDMIITKYTNSILNTVQSTTGGKTSFYPENPSIMQQGTIYLETSQQGKKGSVLLNNQDLVRPLTALGGDSKPGDLSLAPSTADMKGGVITAVEGFLDGDVITLVNFQTTNAPLVSAKRDNFKYDLNPDNIKGMIRTVHLGAQNFSNAQSSDESFQWKDSKPVDFKFDTGLPDEVYLGLKIDISTANLKIPQIAQGTDDPNQEYKWADDYRDVAPKDMQGTKNLDWDMENSVVPKDKMSVCTVVTGAFDGQIPSTSTLTLTFQDKSTKVVQESGSLSVKGMTTGNANLVCQIEDKTDETTGGVQGGSAHSHLRRRQSLSRSA